MLGNINLNTFFNKVLSKVSSEDNFEVLYITGKTHYEDFIKDKNFISGNGLVMKSTYNVPRSPSK